MKSDKPKLKRPIRKVIANVYQALRIETDLDHNLKILDNGAVKGEDHHLTVGVWNIFKGNGGESFFKDFNSIVDSCDLWLLQEVLASDYRLKDYIPNGYIGIHGASYERMDGLREGVMNISKWPARNELHQVVQFKKPEPLVRTPKVSLVSHFTVNNHDVRVINVHQPLVRGRRRAGQDLLEIMEAIQEFEGPTIVAGDFNTFSPKYFKEVCAVMEQYQLHFVPIPQDPRKKIQRLDHIFQRGFQVQSAAIIPEAKSSDHFALRATLVLKR